MCDESHTWQRSYTYNVWRIAHDKGLLFTLKPRWKKILQNEKLKNDSENQKSVVSKIRLKPEMNFFVKKNEKSLWNENFKKF
jgi:hypothetical protein